MDYWRHNPPMHILLKHYVGFKDEDPGPTGSKVQDATELAMMFGLDLDGGKAVLHG